MVHQEFSEEGRKTRFEQWEKYGVDRLKTDLETDPYRRVGSGPVQNLAWEFVRMKEAEQAKARAAEEQPAEMVTLKPGIQGVSIDLKEMGRRIRRHFKRKGRGDGEPCFDAHDAALRSAPR
jgi:hypothetical protein